MGLLLVLWTVEELWWYKRTSGKHQKGTSSIYWQCCLVGQPRSWFSSPVLVLIWAGAQTQLLVHQEPSGETLVNADTPIWHKYQILVIVSGCDTRSQFWCSLNSAAGAGAAPWWRNSGEAQKLEQAGSRQVSPASRRRCFHSSQISQQFAVSMAAAARWLAAPLGGGRGATLLVGGGGVPWWGVGGWWGGRAPPRLIHPTTPPTEP